MGFLSELVLARDLIREMSDGMRELNGVIGGGSMSPLSPGGSPFGPVPAMGPGGINPGVRPDGLQPLSRAATLLGPSGQPISLGGFRTMSMGGGSGGGGGLIGSGGGGSSTYKAISGGSGGGGGGGSRIGSPITALPEAKAIVGGLERIVMEIQNLRKEQRDTTGLRAKGLV